MNNERQLNPANYVQVLGTLGRTPEIRYAPSGMAVLSLNVSKSMGKNKKTDEWYPSLWMNWKCFGDLAEEINSLQLQRGHKLELKGYMKPSAWTDKKTGEQRTGIDFYVVQYDPNPGVPQ